MSYILDALKKSDQERKQGDVPNLQTVHIPVAPEPGKPWVLYAVVLVLFMLVAFMIGSMMSTSSEPKAVVYPSQRDAEKNDEQDLSDTVQVAKVDRQREPEKAPILQPENAAEKVIQSTKLEANRPEQQIHQGINDLANVPYLHELPDYQQQLVPAMIFAGHVYSSASSNRSVIINNRAMSEGDTIMDGMAVEQITQKGVVFRFNEIVFRVDVLQDWSFE